MFNRLLLIFVLSGSVVFGSDMSNLLKNEATRVFDRTVSKFDENYFTLFKEWSKCKEHKSKYYETACQEAVNQKIKKSLKQDLRTMVPLIVSNVVVGTAANLTDSKIGTSIANGASAIISIPDFMIAGDATCKIVHLVVTNLME